MFKNFIRGIALCLSAIIFLCCFAGCGSKGDGDKKDDTAKVDSSKFLVDPEQYRGTTVTYVTWKDPSENEDGPVVEAFEKKYGINVEIQLVNQGEYLSKVAASIAAEKQGDIYFCNGTFPGYMSVMQPLDNAMINLKDPIWRQDTIANSTVDGHPYLVDTVSNIWSEVYICVFNKKIFADNNITSPKEYYEAGKWTFDAFKKCVNDVVSLGKGYIGAEVIGEAALGAAGASFYKYEDNQIKLNVNDRLYDVMTMLSQLNSEGKIVWGRQKFSEGKIAIGFTDCFGLKRTGHYSTINPDHLDATYLPVWEEGQEPTVSGIRRGWGLIKGAKNPVGAGIFLREYLDVNNYDLDLTFHSEDVANFFFEATSKISKDMVYACAEDMFYSTGLGDWYHETWHQHAPSQMRGYLEGELNVMNSIVKKANDIIETERAWLKENYQ